jgi:hypothetical protein
MAAIRELESGAERRLCRRQPPRCCAAARSGSLPLRPAAGCQNP